MIDDFVILAIGVTILLIAVNFFYKHKKIKKNGIITEGVVFELLNSSISSINLRYPIIRFTTLDQEWITETANNGALPGFYKKGQRVKIIYLQENPKQFIINSKANDILIYGMMVIGFLLIFLSIFKLIQVVL